MTDLAIWEAVNSPGEPTCVTGNLDDGGYSLSLYRDDDGVILGGVVSDGVGVVTAFGYIHAGEYLKEVEAGA